MKLYLLPNKTGNVFIAPSSADCYMVDVGVADTSEFVALLEKSLGIQDESVVFNVRLCSYYKLLKKWFAKNESNVLCKSFEIAPLSTARQMLQWRDELKMAQWDFECDDPTSRLGALAEVEQTEVVKGWADRMIHVCHAVEESPANAFVWLNLVLPPMQREVLPPLLRSLLDAVERHGATIESNRLASNNDNNLSRVRSLLLSDDKEIIQLDKKDKSFEVLEFENEFEQDEYMVVCQPDFKADLFINPNTKKTDNRLFALNLPTVGSVITSRSRILNLMPLALALFDEYLQINKLVEWFTAPVHPLPRRFRFMLAETISRTGGFLNKECREVVKRYCNGDFTSGGTPEERDEKLRLYVPYLDSGYRNGENTKHTLSALANWARQRVYSLEEGDNREGIALQLSALADNINILMLLFSERGERFDLSLANEWVRDISREVTLPQHPARVGCAFTVADPWDIAAVANNIVWVGCENGSNQGFECEFLLPGERQLIETHASFWKREDESRMRYLNSIMPFLFAAESLTITYAVKSNGEMLVPHPLLTRFRTQVKDFTDFVRHDSAASKMTKPVEAVDNVAEKLEYHFHNADMIKFPERISATALETLTLYPFDFLFDRLLNFQAAGLSGLPGINTTRGNVAHAVIARLFSPNDIESGCGAAEIKKRVESDYDTALQEVIKECGAIFMLPENKLERSNLHYQLRRCIDSLIDIIEDNHLTVDSCERHYSGFVGLDEENNAGEEDLHGYLDMKLTDREGNPVVFDLKWTRSRKYHRSLLEQNRSTQLAVYSELLKEKDRNVRTAYFLMPRGVIVTADNHFSGRNVVVVDKENDDDIMRQLINSFRYRRSQLLSGIVEEGEFNLIGELQYEADRVTNNLFPLPGDEDPDVKKENRFSIYRLFKGL
ncbi:MAG: PD-(D/E)XK nuclease family protein [Bacteroides sp.]|nr:PD-(D/E)XK nuclease family protein [Bacteroides sp.]